MEEKKHKVEVEKHVNNEQARIWKMDYDNFNNFNQQQEDKVIVI